MKYIKQNKTILPDFAKESKTFEIFCIIGKEEKNKWFINEGFNEKGDLKLIHSILCGVDPVYHPNIY